MRDHYLKPIEITNQEVPDSIRKEVTRVQARITELEDIRISLRASRSYENDYIEICRGIMRAIVEARDGIRTMNEYDGTRDPKNAEKGLLDYLKDHCLKLWDDPFRSK